MKLLGIFAMLALFFTVQPIMANEKDDNYINYSINLMWIFKDKDPQEKYVFPVKYENKEIEPVIKGWATKNTDAPIVFWYDSKQVSPDQISNSQDLFNSLNKTLERKPGKEITLRDVQTLAKAQEEPEVFSDRTPLYFRVDILRVMAAIPYIESCGDNKCFFVYADISVDPMSKAQLFDKKTTEKLAKYGALFAKGPTSLGVSLGTFGVEHIFHIISNNKPKLLEALKTVTIDLNIERAKNALQGKLDTKVKPQTNALQELIYESIPRLFEYFYHLEGLGEILKNGVKYDKAVHGDQLFDATHAKTKWQNGWKFKPIDSSIWNENLNEIRVPTKKISSTRVRNVVKIP